ncbi:MAG TPA: ATP-binding cassette domain-containing protein [Acidimicrobiia bacterium]|jgi:ABC-2 type transport system ATP-binding protein
MTTTTTAATKSTAPVLQLDQLTKRYRDHVAVDHLTVDVPAGVVAGFIGPNGAGKTTTMAMLLGLVRPTSGHATVLGESIAHPERYLGGVGALVEGPALWPGLTGIENLELIARLSGGETRTVGDVLEQVGLTGRGQDRFGTYSFGMKQRLAIGAALLGEPRLLVLDEPTNGLDPVGITEMRDLIRALTRADRTILVSSHILSELEQVSDWLLVIDHGHLVYSGDAAGFAARASVEIVLGCRRVASLLPLADIVAAHGLEVGREDDVLIVTPDGRDPDELAEQLNRHAASAGIVLSEVHVRRPTLESSYLELLEGVSR